MSTVGLKGSIAGLFFIYSRIGSSGGRSNRSKQQSRSGLVQTGVRVVGVIIRVVV